MSAQSTVPVVAAKRAPAKVGAIARLITTEGLESVSIGAGVAKQLGFTAAAGSTLSVPAPTGSGVELLVGLGPADAVTPVTLRNAAAAAVKAAGSVGTLAIDAASVAGLLDDRVELYRALGEGATVGSYQFNVYRSKPTDRPSKITVLTGGARPESAAVARGVSVGEAICFARDLVNEPGGSLVPSALADRVATMATAAGVKCTVWDLKRIKKERLGGLLAVNQGSHHEPRVIRLDYQPAKAKAHIVLVGKGVTFDSGGLSLKPAEAMMTMKCDMGGAAAVLATVLALPALGLPIRVTALAPVTDNMTGADAQRPGDVFTARNGTTVEVLNTDAEGRLILADALVLASELKPDAIVDLATLTGACMVALGDKMAGLLADDDPLADELLEAAGEAGELLWRLPLVPQYRKLLDSPVADLKNIGGRFGGTITAALFLKEFVADHIAWAHLDIAGPAFAEDVPADGPRGGTGFGVRTLLRFLQDRASA